MAGVVHLPEKALKKLNNILDGDPDSFGVALNQYIKNYEQARKDSASKFNNVNVEY